MAKKPTKSSTAAPRKGAAVPRSIDQILRDKAKARKERPRETPQEPRKPQRATPAPPRTPERTSAPRSKVRAPKVEPLRLIVRSDIVKLPKGGTARVDRYRYPKGHPKAGQYAPREVAKDATLTRQTRNRKGEWKEVERSESGKKVRQRKTANMGPTYATRIRDYSAAEAVGDAVNQGKNVFVKLGGKVYEVPEDRAADLQAFIADTKARFASQYSRKKGVSPLFIIGFIEGTSGVMLNFDAMDAENREVKDELQAFGQMDTDEEGQQLAEYMARSAAEYLGIDTDAEDITQAWEDDFSDYDNEESEWD